MKTLRPFAVFLLSRCFCSAFPQATQPALNVSVEINLELDNSSILASVLQPTAPNVATVTATVVETTTVVVTVVPPRSAQMSPNMALTAQSSQSSTKPVAMSPMAPAAMSQTAPGSQLAQSVTMSPIGSATMTAQGSQVSAQSEEPPPDPYTHTVEVGAKGDLLFSPPRLDARVGDVVNFKFLALNHTLTQSTLEAPCTPAGFDTGFIHYNLLNSSDNILSFLVQNSDPQWFFCNQRIPVSHCASGMVFALNPGSLMDEFMQNVGKVSSSRSISRSEVANTGLSNITLATSPPSPIVASGCFGLRARLPYIGTVLMIWFLRPHRW